MTRKHDNMTTTNKANLSLLPDGEAGRGLSSPTSSPDGEVGRGHITPPTGEPEGASLLSSTYFGPVQWFQKLNTRRCILEQHDNFVKQTYRNRCVIASANGPQTLTVPTERYEGLKCPMRDIRISDHGEWRHLHWQALVSAYGETPFFEYYADDLRPFFAERRWKYLFDFNLEITHTLCSLLDVRPTLSLSEHYMEATPELHDLRDAIRPKRPLPDPEFTPRPYYQVRAARHGFLPNLSVLDLLFNEGPEAIFWLM